VNTKPFVVVIIALNVPLVFFRRPSVPRIANEALGT